MPTLIRGRQIQLDDFIINHLPLTGTFAAQAAVFTDTDNPNKFTATQESIWQLIDLARAELQTQIDNVNSAIAGGVTFIGTLPANAADVAGVARGGSYVVGTVPTTWTTNWDPKLETGDYLIWAGTEAATTTTALVQSNWVIVQKNIDGAVTASGTVAAGQVAVFNGNGNAVEAKTLSVTDGTNTISGVGSFTFEATNGATVTVNSTDRKITIDAQKVTMSSTGTGAYVTDVTMTGDAITVTKGDLPELPELSLANGTTGDVVTSLGVNDHKITVNKTSYAALVAGMASRFVVGETPTGAVNGTNKAFTTASAFVAGSEMVMLNGQVLVRNADYTVNGSTITLTHTTAPEAGETIRVNYIKANA